MIPDEGPIPRIKILVEKKTGWGDSSGWTNQDFIRLSELIQQKTGVTLSHVTLKRIWGKVKYESLPNTHTLDTLVQYLDFENWREFVARSSPDPNGHPTASSAEIPGDPKKGPRMDPGSPSPGRRIIWLTLSLLLVTVVLLFLHGQQPGVQAKDYSFSSKKVVTKGLPNSVIFDYDASRATDDSVVIQQSWDSTRRVKVPRNGHQHTSVYYYPDFYHATLQVQNQVVKTHNLLIESDGWLPLIARDPVPVYFTKADVIAGGKMSLSLEKVREKNVPMQPEAPTVWFFNVHDYGDIYTDHFTFETSLKNDYSEGSAICQQTKVYLLCEGTAIWVPLCAKGCISTLDLYFTYFYTTGKREDLSAFGVDFHDYVNLRIESDSGRAKILINNKPAYTINRNILHSKIIGIAYRFEGTGSVDYVRLSNGKRNYEDDFGQPAPSTPAGAVQ